ncbi:cytochrome c peroxidase [Parabacteroides bouchesdurhonensis]|uniref:cytochrome c peroxidase n=1 Tax=Parabacteroides bouchesdurhonensis TaxID=1936995 RepID=UPI000C83A6B3|nr:cytochrome c peroxidase [Parabacteroides bouchesdurhonensis]RHJ91386.1 cytochrome B6 [Bacteroides sp. AM07-16]
MRNTILCKMAALPVGLFVLAFLTQSCTSEYKKYAGDEAKQVASIIRENGCLQCHAANAALPFYGKLPLIGPVVKADMLEGTRYLDLTAMVNALENGQPVSEVDMAKVENTALSGTMPPVKYYTMPMHWGTNLDSEERAVIISWAKSVRKNNYTSPTVSEEFMNEPVQPLMTSIPTNPDKVALGFALYHDTRLSGDNTISCSTCHGLNTGGVDRKQYSEGIKGQFGGVNAPTVYNAALNCLQFWDGRAADLKEQAAGPPLNPVEMGSASFDEISAKLAADKDFSTKFLAVYPEGFNQSTITDAIAEFEKTLLTPSRFDKYLMGDKSALTAEELEGYQLFKDNKCATCHVGMNIGGQSFEYMGIKNNYFDYRGTGLTDGDNGRFAVTKDEMDRHKFKTPTLRNVMITAPYMHDGTVASVEDAIRIMHQFQIGKNITDPEIKKIVAYLNTLTGEYNGALLQ